MLNPKEQCCSNIPTLNEAANEIPRPRFQFPVVVLVVPVDMLYEVEPLAVIAEP